jgi:prepilin-type N-terminal cleavage/methylation domain-containing protein
MTTSRSRQRPADTAVRTAGRRPRGRGRGYTAVEVLMAMTVMAIGAAAVISMQKTSIQGNLDARQTDVANAIARTWVERLRSEAMQWTAPGPSNPTGNNFTNPPLAILASAPLDQWFLPQNLNQSPIFSPAFDILGRDLPAGDYTGAKPSDPVQVVFCVNVRLHWLVRPAPTALPPEPGLLRADVRVLWPRGLVGSPPGGWCTTTAVDNPDPTNPPVYHSLYVTTTLQENPQ